MARCVADDCLNPCYIKDHLEHPTEISRWIFVSAMLRFLCVIIWDVFVCKYLKRFLKFRKALEAAHKLLQMKHGIVRLDNVWGFGGGIRPVKTLIKKVKVTNGEEILFCITLALVAISCKFINLHFINLIGDKFFSNKTVVLMKNYFAHHNKLPGRERNSFRCP